MPNVKNIIVGTPNQTKVSGAIKRAPSTTAAPADASTNLTGTWTSGGYVDEDGVTITPELSTSDIRDWNKSVVRKLIDGFDGTIEFTYLEFGDPESLKQQFGDKYVSSASGKTKLSLGAHMGDIQSWVIDVKDGDVAVRVYVPNGQITENGEIQLVNGEAIKSKATLSCYDDGTGNSIYIFIDGEVVSA